MWNRFVEWFSGRSSLDIYGEKKTPEIKPSEPLPQPEKSMLTELARLDREREELAWAELKDLQEKLDKLLLTEQEFDIGDQVEYQKVPNDNVKFYVTYYIHSRIVEYYGPRIYPGVIVVKYFDSNQIIQTVDDREIKWFKKV